jgi:hypothetical protein
LGILKALNPFITYEEGRREANQGNLNFICYVLILKIETKRSISKHGQISGKNDHDAAKQLLL